MQLSPSGGRDIPWWSGHGRVSHRCLFYAAQQVPAKSVLRLREGRTAQYELVAKGLIRKGKLTQARWTVLKNRSRSVDRLTVCAGFIARRRWVKSQD